MNTPICFILLVSARVDMPTTAIISNCRGRPNNHSCEISTYFWKTSRQASQSYEKEQRGRLVPLRAFLKNAESTYSENRQREFGNTEMMRTTNLIVEALSTFESVCKVNGQWRLKGRFVRQTVHFAKASFSLCWCQLAKTCPVELGLAWMLTSFEGAKFSKKT